MKHQESHVIGRSALRGAFVFLALFLLAFASAHAVDLFVSGIATPAAANGRYVPNGTFSGYDSWVHEAGGYYIYNDFYSTITPALRYWNIDNDLNDEGSASVLFFSSNNSDGASPALVTSWSPDQGTGTPVRHRQAPPIPRSTSRGTASPSPTAARRSRSSTTPISARSICRQEASPAPSPSATSAPPR